MSSVINPVGPEEPSTYWRRRAVVLVALLVLLVGGFLVVRSLLGGSDDDQSGSPPPTSASQTPAASGEAVDASGSPGTGEAAGVPACAPGDIAVTAAPAEKSTSVGQGMKLTMTIANTSKAACSRDVGASANELQVTSGSVLVWSSDFCGAAGTPDVEVIDPGQEYSSTVTWPGTVVTEECPSNPPDAKAGGYKVTGRNGELRSEAVAFTVE